MRYACACVYKSGYFYYHFNGYIQRYNSQTTITMWIVHLEF